MIQISFICSWSMRTYSYSNTMWEKSRANLCRILCTFSIKDCIRHIKALSRILELQVNCFTQTKTLQNSGGGGAPGISTFDGNFHEFLKQWVKEGYSFQIKNTSALIIPSALIFVRKLKLSFLYSSFMVLWPP